MRKRDPKEKEQGLPTKRMCRNNLHRKPRKRGPCPKCASAKAKRRRLKPGRQEVVNKAHKNWRIRNPAKYAEAQKVFWADPQVKEWNRKRMRDRRAKQKKEREAEAKRAKLKALVDSALPVIEKVDRLKSKTGLAAKTEHTKNPKPDQYGIIRKERPL